MNLRKSSCYLLLGILALFQVSCNLTPVFNKPTAGQNSTFKYRALVDSMNNVPIDTAWWNHFQDPVLNDLITRVSTKNYDLQAAVHSFEQVRSLARVDRSSLLPELNLNNVLTRRQVSTNSAQNFRANNFYTYELNLLASYQLDLWGKLRSIYKASLINTEISLLEYYNLLSTLRAQTASLYFNIRQLDRQIALYDSTIVTRQQSLTIAHLNYQAGASDALDEARAETQLRSAESARWTVLNQRAKLENALAILSGSEPADFSIAVDPLDKLPTMIPTKIPSEVLTKRPDIWIALKSMEIENAYIGVARANLYPSLTLSAQAGFQSRDFSTVFSPTSFSWSLAGGLVQPIFNYGKNRAALEAARSRYEQVADLYQQSVLTAFGEVENELANIYFLQQQHTMTVQTVAAASRALDLAKQRYEAGLVSYLEVVDAERTALLNQVDLVTIEGQLYQGIVNLSLVAGGSWERGPQLLDNTQPDNID